MTKARPSTRAKWRALRSAGISTLEKVLDAADIVREGIYQQLLDAQYASLLSSRLMIALLGRVAAILLLATSALCQTTDKNSLQCEIPAAPPGEEHPVFPMSSEEAARLHEAPHGAKRLSEHQLQVRWAAGTRIFKDKPPYDEPLDGVSWAYCGYNASLKLHLIHKADNWLFTGVLLDDNTGLMLPGGLAILFSPDHSLYLAYERPDGQDGETLKLYKRAGVLLWKGYDFIASPDGKSVIVDTENMRNMRWDSQNRPQATLYLRGGRTMIVTLMRDDKGKLEWLPRVTLP